MLAILPLDCDLSLGGVVPCAAVAVVERVVVLLALTSSGSSLSSSWCSSDSDARGPPATAPPFSPMARSADAVPVARSLAISEGLRSILDDKALCEGGYTQRRAWRGNGLG